MGTLPIDMVNKITPETHNAENTHFPFGKCQNNSRLKPAKDNFNPHILDTCISFCMLTNSLRIVLTYDSLRVKTHCCFPEASMLLDEYQQKFLDSGILYINTNFFLGQYLY